MTDTMHAHPVSSGSGVGGDEAHTAERLAISDEKRSLPWETAIVDEPVWAPDSEAPAAVPSADAWAEDAAVTKESPVTQTTAHTDTDRTAASEARHENTRSASGRLPMLISAGVAGTLAVALIAAVAIPRLSAFGSGAPVNGLVSIVSDQRARVSIDGKDRGAAPVDVTLEPGPHAVRVSSAQGTEVMTIAVTAGTHEVHHVHAMGSAPVGAAGTSSLRVTTPEPGARIVLDGEFRGLTPMLFASLTPGTHSVVVSKGALSVRREVAIAPDRTIELELVPSATNAPAAGDAGGWIDITSPFDVEIWEAGTLVGSTRTARLMLKPGTHSLDLVNETLLYRVRRSVDVAAGRTTALRITAPQGTLSVNAAPWADVWVDGSRVGETPLGDISVAIGSHDVVLRHPDFGERHVQSVVRVGEVTRVAIDLRKPATER